MATPPTTPPTIAPVCDLLDGDTPDAGTVVVDEEVGLVVGFGVDAEVDEDV